MNEKSEIYLSRRQNKGAALVTVLMTLAIVLSVSTAIIARQQLDIRRSANILNMEQSLFYAYAVETWAKNLIAEDSYANDNFKEDWAKPLKLTEIDNGTLSGNIEDMQARFNINNLTAENTPLTSYNKRCFIRLMRRVGIDEAKIEVLLKSLIDWLDSDKDIFPSDNSEDYDYLALKPPCYPPDFRMTSPTEFLLVNNTEYGEWRKLAPYMTALPQTTAININTASPVVMESLGDNIDSFAIENLAELRKENPFGSVNDFIEKYKMFANRDINIDTSILSVNSGYFKLTAKTSFGEGKVILNSLIYRTGDNVVKILYRSLGDL